jgi:predicted HTH transcriptional regulator
MEYDESYIKSLFENKIIESRMIEYKKKLPGNSDGDKKEFLADISSFANSVGGTIFYGIKEKAGIPSEPIGILDVIIPTTIHII